MPSAGAHRLSSVSSHDSGFVSQDANTHSKPPSPMPSDIASQVAVSAIILKFILWSGGKKGMYRSITRNKAVVLALEIPQAVMLQGRRIRTQRHFLVTVDLQRISLFNSNPLPSGTFNLLMFPFQT